MSRKIGLIDADLKNRRNLFRSKKVFPNLALMKLSAYYKQHGYDVEWYSPLLHDVYDKVFASKVFNKRSPCDMYLKRKFIIKGGTGYNNKFVLPFEIEHIYPDYDLYGIDYALGFITRGCPRKCSFCVVPTKEGNIRKHANLEEFCSDQRKVRLLDNNFLAYKNHITELKKLINSYKKIEFNQGLDIRLINSTNANLLRKLKRWTGQRYRFAFDSPNLRKLIEKKLIILNNAKIPNTAISFYMLVGYNTSIEQDIERIEFMKEKRILAYVMPYDLRDPYQQALRKYVNKHFYKVMDFKFFLKNYGSKKQITAYLSSKNQINNLQHNKLGKFSITPFL